MGIIITYALIWASCFEFTGKSMETQKTAQSEFTNGEKAIAEQILASEERKKSKRAGMLRVTVRDPSMKVNHLKSFVISPEFTRSTSSTRIG